MRTAAFLLSLLLGCAALSQTPPSARPDAITPDGGRYYGPLRDGKLHGSGRLEWGNGDVYEGGFVDGLMSGRGVLRQATGDLFDGEFRGGRMNGPGRMVKPDGDTYVGEFRDDYFHGQGRYETPQREVYEGDFNNSEFTGRGALTRTDGSRYEGEFVNWRFHGRGRYGDGRGNTYEGNFVNGSLEGTGKLSAPGGESYEGEFKQWRFHGQGVLRLANGDVYRGGFAHGSYEGEGTLTYAKPRPDGATRETGVWRYGALDNREQRRASARNVEAVLYNQRALLAGAVASLKPRDPARINLFLLAIAGDGSQEVFRREVEFVSRQFEQRFGTGGRTIALINSRSTVETAPMATTTSIRESLAAIAGRMDKEQDILFVFLTSHGSRQHELVLSQNSMDLPDLPASELGRLLKESGIRWKVVLISACYSGGFTDALKDDSTLVIAAARHDRQSFGCADENEFTYFGRAFFKEALPQASSFQEAFRKAEVLVKEMELQQSGESPAGDKPAEVEHSLPQMSVAEPIERQLRRWWSQPR